ncbi:hypothetical protein E1286_21180 [Nonomuraea terrae]|uniref:Uncharacterized protein n=1 Tax=Nonomuraea terrae TaxID=2530383 RepID=A0A4V2YLE2_9ACTN|nr:hypothetical protein [Nonomuraea terrae]TDD46377.1 hypothetical protein E1286_21180 [Nonomuraea terrae]
MGDQPVVRAGVVAVCLLLAGCGSGGGEPVTAPAPTSVSSAPPEPETPTAPETPPEREAPSEPESPSAAEPPRDAGALQARDGARLRACRDADCEVVVADGQSVELAPKWGLGTVEFTVEDGAVSFTSFSGGMMATFGEQTPNPSGVSSVNGIDVRVLAVQGRRAVIRISH